MFPLPPLRFADATAIVVARTNGGGWHHADTLVQQCLSLERRS